MSGDERGSSLHQQTTIKSSSSTSTGWPAWPPPPRSRPPQRTSTSLAIVIMVLAALLVLGGLSLTIGITTNQYGQALGAQRGANANATVQATIKHQATLVSSLNATQQPLATAQARINATATAQNVPTATVQSTNDGATATTTALGDMLTTDTQGTPTLDDPLTDNSLNHQWDVGYSDNNNTGCNFVDGAYVAQEALQGILQPCFADATNFDNFVYQVSVTNSSRGEVGILFRGDKDSGQYYLFLVDVSGAYTLGLYDGNKYRELSAGISPVISAGAGQSNNLAVIVDKHNFYLYVNQNYIGKTTDETLGAGQVGVVVVNTGLPVKASFSNAQIWTI